MTPRQKIAVENVDVILTWINKVSPLALIGGLVYATIWANNLTHSVGSLQQTIVDHVGVGAHSDANDRLTKIESDVSVHLKYIRRDLDDIKKRMEVGNGQ